MTVTRMTTKAASGRTRSGWLWILTLTLVTATALGGPAPRVSAITELVVNGSVETVDSADATRPNGWSKSRWGTNTATFSYPTGDAHTGSRFTRVTMTSRTNGDAKWSHDHVPVTANTTYTFTDWYRSNTTTQLTAEFRSTSGTLTYKWLKDVPPASIWTPTTATLITPANTTSVTIYHLIYSTGTLDTDDTSLTTTTSNPPPPATTTTTTTTLPTTTPPPPTTAAPPPGGDSRPVIYLTFDDGPSRLYTQLLLDVLDRHGVKATFFMIGQEVARSPSVAAEVQARGHAVGNHTYNHLLLTDSRTDVSQQLADTSAALLSATGRAPTCARPPQGQTNAAVDSIARNLGLTMFNSGSPNLDGGDYTTPQISVAQMKAVLDRIASTPDPIITTFHDGGGDRANTVQAFDEWLGANAARYRFETLPACG